MRLRSTTLMALALMLLPGRPAALSIGAGPLGGVNLGNAYIDGHADSEMRTGLSLGARAELGVTSPWSLLVEGVYVQKGARFDYDAGPLGNINASGELDYFEIPVLAKAKLGSMAGHAYLFAGPALGINLEANGRIGSFSDTFKDQAASVVWSGQVGGGGAFRLQRYLYLTADGRYARDFSDALEDDVGDIESWHSWDIRLQAGLLIHLAE
jgi:hypothetical protein